MKPWMVVLLIAAGVLCFLARWGKLVPVVASVEMGHPVVVLDAGHGGEDGGAMTASGHRESDINLQIVNKLDDFMALCGVETVLTRSEDVSLHTPGAEERGERKRSDLDYRVQLSSASTRISFPTHRYGVHRYFIHWEMWVVSGGSTPSRRSGM